MRRGVAAEYASEAAIVAAIGWLRARGFSRLEVFSPYPSHAIDRALGAPRSLLSIAAGIGGIVGAAGAYALQWFLVAYLYPIDTGARPAHMPLPFVIITVEMGFLVGAGTLFLGFVAACRLLRLWDPIFEVPGIESATRAHFWLAISATDPRWRLPAIEAALAETSPRQVHGFGGVG